MADNNKAIDDEGFPGEWKYIKNSRIFIRDGEDFQQALARRVAKQWEERDRQIFGNKKQAEKATAAEKSTNPKDYVDDYLMNHDIGIGGGKAKMEEFLRVRGFTDDEIEQTRSLTSEHSGYHYEDADKKIVHELESGSRIGKAFEARIEWEEAMYKLWIAKHKDDADAYKFKIYNGEKTIYRKGDRKSGVEPWTTLEDGPDMGHGGIGYNHKATIEQLLREGYHILGGIGNHLGSPGESEITFVKYRRK